uniref:GNAT family N-acetyltransferase n=1 Tax=Sphingomonas bacterium TaxID=1895847 RepID=UPI00345C149A
MIESARLRMRPLSVDDAEAMHVVYSDEEAMRYWSHPALGSLEESRAELTKKTASSDWRAWAITLKGDDTAIGQLAAHEKRQGKVIEIGYALARPLWGQGYAREAVSRLLDLLFREEGNRRVFADTDPDNTGSNSLLESLGFVREGVLRGEWETHLGVRDSFIWGLLAEEWTAR